MTLMARSIPPISEQFFAELDRAFKFDIQHLDVKATIEEVQRHAGERRVVEWCRRHIRSHSVTGDVEVIVKPS